MIQRQVQDLIVNRMTPLFITMKRLVSTYTPIDTDVNLPNISGSISEKLHDGTKKAKGKRKGETSTGKDLDNVPPRQSPSTAKAVSPGVALAQEAPDVLSKIRPRTSRAQASQDTTQGYEPEPSQALSVVQPKKPRPQPRQFKRAPAATVEAPVEQPSEVNPDIAAPANESVKPALRRSSRRI